MDRKRVNEIILLIAISLIIILSYFIIKDYITSILTACILAYLLFPVFTFLSKFTSKKLAAILSILLIIIILLIPLSLLVNILINQSQTFATSENLNLLINKLSEFLQNSQIRDYAPSIIKELGSFIASMLSSLISYIPSLLISLFIILFGTYYLLTESNVILTKAKSIVPLNEKKKEEIFKNISQVTKGIVYGTFLVAVIEFIIAIIGFSIAAVDFSLFLSFIIFLTAFIPLLGATIVWIPLAILLLLQSQFFSAIIVIITGLILTIFVEQVIRLKIMQKQADIHPIILLLGILGGVSLFGLTGLILGPLILGFLVKIIEAVADNKE